MPLKNDRTFIIGRRERRSGARMGSQARRPHHLEIHIWIPDSTVSKRHAELNVLNGRVYLRDLQSTNGTYLIADGKREKFTEGYVELDQRVCLGEYCTTIRALIDSA